MATIWRVLSAIVILSCFHMNETSEKACSEWATMDIVFLVSRSLLEDGRVGSSLKSFLCSLVDSFYVGEDKVQIGLSTLSYDVDVAFLLNTFHQPQVIKARIRNLSLLPRNGSMVDDRVIVFDLFSEAVGGRYGKGVPQIAVYITEQYGPFGVPSKMLSKHGITVHRIVYSSDTQKWTVLENSMEKGETSTDKLEEISQEVSGLLCASAELMLPLDKGPLAVCPQGMMADILFLVDGTSSVGLPEFKSIKDFLYTLVGRFYVGPDQVQIGLVQYSDNFLVEFTFNTYPTKEEILRHLLKISSKINDTKSLTVSGRDFLSSHFFTGPLGSRAAEGVPQIGVVISNSGVTDPLKDSLLELKTRGIKVYAVGIGNKIVRDFPGVADKNYRVDDLKNFFELLRPSQDAAGSFFDSLCGTAKQNWLSIVHQPAGQGDALVENQVTLQRGKPLIVQCLYDEKYKDHVKYWCRMTSENVCSVIVRSDAPQNRGYVSISDHPDQHLFNVILKNLQTMDSAIYVCGVETSQMETYIYIADLNLTVTAGAPPLSTDNNNVVVEVGGNVIFQCLFAEENAGREKKWCRRGDWGSCVTETGKTTGQGGLQLHVDSKYRILTVIASGLEMDDKGWYWCVAGDQHIPYQINVLPENTTFTTTPEIAELFAAFTMPLDLALRPVLHRQILRLLFSATNVLIYLVCTIVAAPKVWAYCKQKKDEGLSITTQNGN